MKIVAFYSNLITAGVTQRKLVVKLRNISVATERKVVGSSGNVASVAIPSLPRAQNLHSREDKQAALLITWLVTRIISIQCSTLYFWPIKVFIMDAAAGGLTSDQKNNMKYSTRLKVFYHLNIGKGIMLLVSDRRRTARHRGSVGVFPLHKARKPIP